MVVKPKAISETTTDIVVYDRHQNDIDISMTAVFPTFCNILMTSERSHYYIEKEFIKADWIIPQLFDELNGSAPSS